jgi:hypothetical protein
MHRLRQHSIGGSNLNGSSSICCSDCRARVARTAATLAVPGVEGARGTARTQVPVLLSGCATNRETDRVTGNKVTHCTGAPLQQGRRHVTAASHSDVHAVAACCLPHPTHTCCHAPPNHHS